MVGLSLVRGDVGARNARKFHEVDRNRSRWPAMRSIPSFRSGGGQCLGCRARALVASNVRWYSPRSQNWRSADQVVRTSHIGTTTL